MAGAPGLTKRTLERADQIRRLAGESYSAYQIAEIMEIHVETVRSIALKTKIEIPGERIRSFTTVDPVKIIGRTVEQVQQLDMALDFAFEYVYADRVQAEDQTDWIEALESTKKKLTKFIKFLKENSDVKHRSKTATAGQGLQPELEAGTDTADEGQPDGATSLEDKLG